MASRDPRRLLVTGATGFLGRELVPRALERFESVVCFVRPSSDLSQLPRSGRLEFQFGDLACPGELAAALAEVDALLNLASLGKGHADVIVGDAVAAGVPRAVFVSTTAIFTKLNAPSKLERMRAEQLIEGSGLNFTILRPTMIYGRSRDRNMARLVKTIRRYPVLPIPGWGKNLQQPVYVGDVARACLDVLHHSQTIGNAYSVSGAYPLTYREVVRTVTGLLGVRTVLLPLPAGQVIHLLALLEGMGLTLPIKAEQIKRLNEDKAFAYGDARRDFGYAPLDFAGGMHLQLEEMGLLP